jgi:hypothetical protein
VSTHLALSSHDGTTSSPGGIKVGQISLSFLPSTWSIPLGTKLVSHTMMSKQSSDGCGGHSLMSY